MGKALSILFGLILIALGVWGVITWRSDVVGFIKAAVVIMAIIIGLGIFVFGLSELRAGNEEPPRFRLGRRPWRNIIRRPPSGRDAGPAVFDVRDKLFGPLQAACAA